MLFYWRIPIGNCFFVLFLFHYQMLFLFDKNDRRISSLHWCDDPVFLRCQKCSAQRNLVRNLWFCINKIFFNWFHVFNSHSTPPLSDLAFPSSTSLRFTFYFFIYFSHLTIGQRFPYSISVLNPADNFLSNTLKTKKKRPNIEPTEARISKYFYFFTSYQKLNNRNCFHMVFALNRSFNRITFIRI